MILPTYHTQFFYQAETRNIHILFGLKILSWFCLFVCVEVLQPSQQLRSCRAGQLPINTVNICFYGVLFKVRNS